MCSLCSACLVGQYQLNWYPSNSSAYFLVDNVLRAQYSGANLVRVTDACSACACETLSLNHPSSFGAQVPNLGQLWIAAWFPNAWAGEPSFGSCTMEVDYVQMTPVE